MIKIDKYNPEFDNFKFVISAFTKLKGYQRDHLTHIQVKSGNMTATDEHRIHTYKQVNDPLPGGYYEVIKNTKTLIWLNKTEDIQYLEWADLFEINDYTLIDGVTEHINASYVDVVREMKDHYIQYNYFVDALSYGDMTIKVPSDNGHPIILEDDGKRAAIMPAKRK